MRFLYYNILVVVLVGVVVSILSCAESSKNDVDRVWGGGNMESSDVFDLIDIQTNGELIVLTQYGPETYFEFKGKGFGSQFMIIEEFAKSIGVGVRVEVARSDSEAVEKLLSGDGDVIACGLPVKSVSAENISLCGEKEISQLVDSLSKVDGQYAWAVRKDAVDLADVLSKWLADNQSNFADMMTLKISDGSGRKYKPRRKAYSPYLDLARGRISTYDDLFKNYSHECGWDWRLIAAQAYQESAFDCEAVSWAGAMGLMQLMPSTASSVGVSMDDIFVPESNLRGAVRYIRTLESHYSDIQSGDERINFVLAAYNAGPGHIDDARRLATKHGVKSDVWSGGVDKFVLHMSEARYYNDEVVRHGYFRGTETYNYVYDIRERWREYREKIH